MHPKKLSWLHSSRPSTSGEPYAIGFMIGRSGDGSSKTWRSHKNSVIPTEININFIYRPIYRNDIISDRVYRGIGKSCV